MELQFKKPKRLSEAKNLVNHQSSHLVEDEIFEEEQDTVNELKSKRSAIGAIQVAIAADESFSQNNLSEMNVSLSK